MTDRRNPFYATERWANAVVALIDCANDPRTLRAWGRSIGLGTSALRARCYAAAVQPKAALSLARLLRVIAGCQGMAFDPLEALDVLDERTLRKLLTVGGLTFSTRTVLAPDVETFLRHQQFVVRSTARQALLNALRPRLAVTFTHTMATP